MSKDRCKAPGMMGDACREEQTEKPQTCAWLMQIETESTPEGVAGLKNQLVRCGNKCAQWSRVRSAY